MNEQLFQMTKRLAILTLPYDSWTSLFDSGLKPTTILVAVTAASCAYIKGSNDILDIISQDNKESLNDLKEIDQLKESIAKELENCS